MLGWIFLGCGVGQVWQDHWDRAAAFFALAAAVELLTRDR